MKTGASLLETALHHSPHFVGVMEANGKHFISVNEYGIRLFDMENEEEMIASTLTDLLKDHPSEQEWAKLSGRIAGSLHLAAPLKFISKKGHEFLGEINIIPFENNSNNYHLVCITNIDGRKLVREEILKEKQKFEQLFEYATIGIIVAGKNGEIAMVNKFTEKQFGFSREELIGEPVEKLLPDEFAAKHVIYRQKFNHSPQNRPMGIGMNLMGKRKDGSNFPVEISLSHYANDDGDFVIAFINDITVRKQNEDVIKLKSDALEQYAGEVRLLNKQLEKRVEDRTMVLRETLHQLEQSREELIESSSFQQAILDNAAVMIIVTDTNGTIKLFNPTAEKCLGYAADEVVNRLSPVVFHDEKETAALAKSLSKEYKTAIDVGFEAYIFKSRKNITNELQCTYIRKDETRFPVNLYITALHNSENEITGFLGVAVDISVQKKAEEDLVIALEKEKELSDLKSRFVSMASHEFRTPLSSILSSASLIRKYTAEKEQDKREKHVARISENVKNLTDILEDFLSLGKLDEGLVKAKFEPVQIREFIANTIRDLDQIRKPQQQVEYKHQGKKTVLTDKHLLKNILNNLVSNALKFSRDDGSVEIKSFLEDGNFAITVKDHGIGISREDQEHLFDRFFRGRNAVNIQGTGLGLHIVSKYLELLKGSIECRSELNSGTEFRVTFFNPNTTSDENDITD